MNRIMAALALASVLYMSPALAGDGQDRRMKIVNNTGSTLTHFYASNVGENKWREEIFGDDVLKPGESVVVNIDDGSGYCRFDLKAEFKDGNEVIQPRVNVCEEGVLVLRDR